MKKKVVVIGSDDMVLGFTLAGVDQGIVPEDDYEAVKNIEHLIEEPDIGVILISEQVAEDIREDLKRIRRKKDLYPVIVEIPGKEGPLEEREDPLKSKIRRAVGIDITTMEEQ